MSEQLFQINHYFQEKIADPNLIAKWKKQGYENLCCLRCIQVTNKIFLGKLVFTSNCHTSRLVTQILQPTASVVCLRTSWRRGGLFFIFFVWFSHNLWATNNHIPYEWSDDPGRVNFCSLHPYSIFYFSNLQYQYSSFVINNLFVLFLWDPGIPGLIYGSRSLYLTKRGFCKLN